MARRLPLQLVQKGISMFSKSLNNQISIRFRHLHPSESTIAAIQNELDIFRERLPKKAVIRADFAGQNKLVKATLKVFSPGGQLFTTATSQSLTAACHQLVHHLARKVEKIKSKRF